MENIAMLILGIFICVLGIVNISGNISTIHSYNRRKSKIGRYSAIRKSCWNGNADYRSSTYLSLFSHIMERVADSICNYSPFCGRSGIYYLRSDKV